MVDDRPEDAGPSAETDRPKREGPTIDLEATEVSSSETQHADAGARPEPTSPRSSASAMTSAVIAAFAGAGAAALVIGAAWFLGWNTPLPEAAPRADTTAIDGLAARVASVESKTSMPAPTAPDAAATARIEALEKSSAALRAELATARAQSEKLAALVNEMKSTPREVTSAAGSVRDRRAACADRTHHARARRRDCAGEYQTGG